MKAQFVNENINFERGIDPKHAMDIGYGKYAEQIFELDDILKPIGFQMEKNFKETKEFNFEVDLMQWRNDKNDIIFLFYHPPVESLKVYFSIGDLNGEDLYDEFLQRIKTGGPQ